MLEVEIRYRSTDRAGVIRKLVDWGAILTQDRHDIDHYFNPPGRDFRVSDESFRLRRIGTINYLTYKGPRRDTETKSRLEIEVPLAYGDQVADHAEQLLRALGFQPVVTVRKKRQVYQVNRDGFNLEVCFDEVERVGAFIELEILAKEEQYATARLVVLQTAADLGLTEKETRSYLGLVLEAQAQQPP
jgi:adenylate cyclase class 2